MRIVMAWVHHDPVSCKQLFVAISTFAQVDYVVGLVSGILPSFA